MYGNTFDFQCQHVVWKSFYGKCTAKIDFPAGNSTIADADIGSLNSFHTLFNKYLEHLLVKFEQNCMIQTRQNFEFFNKND